MKKSMSVVILFLLLFLTSLSANGSDVLKNIKSYETTLVSYKDITFNDKLFKKSSNSFKSNSKKSILIKLELFNSLSKNVEKEVVFTSATIDKLKIFTKKDNQVKLVKDLSYSVREGLTLYPSVSIKLGAKEAKKLYVLVHSKYLPTSFKIKLGQKESFLRENSRKILLYTFIIGLLFSIIVVFVFLYLYTNEVSYIYFSLLLLTALLIHIYLSGLEFAYFSKNFILLDRTLIIIKFNLLFILASIQAIYFYGIKKEDYLYSWHKLYIYIAIVYIVVSGFIDTSSLMLIMFAIYLLLQIITSSIYIIRGRKEAFLYLVAYLLVTTVVINRFYYVDSLEYFSKNHFLIFLVIYLLMALSYLVRFIEKKRKEAKMVNSALERKVMIESKIDKIKTELDKLERSEERLKDRMNTIIKNNLHLVLSMLKMKNSTNLEVMQEIEKLDIRVSLMVRVYSLFLSIKDVNSVDMSKYLPIVLEYIENRYKDYPKRVSVVTKVDAIVTQNEAIDIAISVSDIIMSSYEDGTYIDDKLLIILKVINGSYNLAIKDIGKTKGVLGGKLKSLFSV